MMNCYARAMPPPHKALRESPHKSGPMEAGFTLLEMLVVLVIIGLLAGLVGPQLLSRVDGAKVTTAQTQIKIIKGALQTLRLDLGRFPTAEEGMQMLISAPNDADGSGMWLGPYLDGDLPEDPWGQAYVYRPVRGNSTQIILYSLGADGAPGGEGLDKDIGILPKSNDRFETVAGE